MQFTDDISLEFMILTKIEKFEIKLISHELVLTNKFNL